MLECLFGHQEVRGRDYIYLKMEDFCGTSKTNMNLEEVSVRWPNLSMRIVLEENSTIIEPTTARFVESQAIKAFKYTILMIVHKSGVKEKLNATSNKGMGREDMDVRGDP